MLRRSYLPRLSLAVIALLALAAPLAAAEQVSFRGVLAGSFTQTTLPGTPVTALVVAQGTGTATQLGHFSFDYPLVVYPATQKGNGTHTFTAANGDLVVADVVAESSLVNGLRRVVEVAIIDPQRCTGRFAGATGAYVSERFLDRATGEVIGYFEGSISTPGSDAP